MKESMRNNFNEESIPIWTRENGVSKLTTNLTGWQKNNNQSFIIPEFLELYSSEGSQIWICCSSQVKEQLRWRKYVDLSKRKWSFWSSQQVWRVDIQMTNNHSLYLNFWSCTAPMDLQFGYVVVHELRNNFHEDGFAIWATENGVILKKS